MAFDPVHGAAHAAPSWVAQATQVGKPWQSGRIVVDCLRHLPAADPDSGDSSHRHWHLQAVHVIDFSAWSRLVAGGTTLYNELQLSKLLDLLETFMEDELLLSVTGFGIEFGVRMFRDGVGTSPGNEDGRRNGG